MAEPLPGLHETTPTPAECRENPRRSGALFGEAGNSLELAQAGDGAGCLEHRRLGAGTRLRHRPRCWSSSARSWKSASPHEQERGHREGLEPVQVDSEREGPGSSEPGPFLYWPQQAAHRPTRVRCPGPTSVVRVQRTAPPNLRKQAVSQRNAGCLRCEPRAGVPAPGRFAAVVSPASSPLGPSGAVLAERVSPSLLFAYVSGWHPTPLRQLRTRDPRFPPPRERTDEAHPPRSGIQGSLRGPSKTPRTQAHRPGSRAREDGGRGAPAHRKVALLAVARPQPSGRSRSSKLWCPRRGLNKGSRCPVSGFQPWANASRSSATASSFWPSCATMTACQ